METEQVKLITRGLLKDWGASCYKEEGWGEKVNALAPEGGLTPLEVLDLTIPASDRFWVLFREEVIPAKALRLLACDFAEMALERIKLPDPRSVKAVEVSRAYASGKASIQELRAARLDAYAYAAYAAAASDAAGAAAAADVAASDAAGAYAADADAADVAYAAAAAAADVAYASDAAAGAAAAAGAYAAAYAAADVAAAGGGAAAYTAAYTAARSSQVEIVRKVLESLK